MPAPEVALVLVHRNEHSPRVRLRSADPVSREMAAAGRISCTTWVMFALSHLSIAYAILAVGDLRMAAIFAVNVLAACSSSGSRRTSGFGSPAQGNARADGLVPRDHSRPARFSR
jgi:hypothetical protein